jgi:Flp pilus assembly protein TadD/TolB-like protein
MSLQPGTRLGSFEVLDPLGKGGMGEVYRARDTRLGRDVAIKVLPETFAKDPARLARFEREARLLASVNHPAIAAIYGVEDLDGVPCIVMELVPGETLAEKLAEGPLSLEESLAIARQIAEALEAAHEGGLVHRDLKPANIKVTPGGKVKVLDLGLAKVMEAPSSGELSSFPTQVVEETRPGVILGTLEFMSPEQARGKPVDKRTDIWAFGCVLFEMLSGERPFAGETASDIIAAVLSTEPEWSALPAGTPPRIRELMTRCLRKDRSDRLRDIGDARIEIDLTLEEKKSGTLAAGPPSRRGNRRLAVSLAASALIVAIVIAWLVSRPSRGAREPRAPGAAGPVSLAVLPFRDLSGQANGQILGDGLAETVGARLARSTGLQVVTSSALTSIAEKQSDPFRIAASVGASVIVAGSFQRADNRIRITFAILNAVEKRQIAVDQVTGPASDLFALQDEVADRVAGKLKLPARPGGETPSVSGLKTASQQERYMQALGSLQRYDRSASVDEAIGLLRPLAAEEPGSALVAAALGRAYLFKFNLTRQKSWAEEARSAAARAALLDATLPEVDITLGELRLRTGQAAEAVGSFQRALSMRPNDYEASLGLARAEDAAGNEAAAEAAYRHAIQLQPSYWFGYSKFAGFYFNRGNYPRAVEMFRRVTELAPDSARAFSNLGAAHHQMDRFEEALAAYRRSIAIEPTSGAYSNAGTTEFFLGRYADASRDFEKAVALTPESYDGWANLADAYFWGGQKAPAADAYARAIRLARSDLEVNPRGASARARLAVCLARAGDGSGAKEEIARALALSPRDPRVLYNAAIVTSLAGEDGKAIDWIERAVEAGCGIEQIRQEPQFTSLRKDPRFDRALQRKPPKKA